MKLISMTEFVLEKNKYGLYKYNQEQHRNYANFLKQPLKLEMFIPCDEDENVIKLPNTCICTDLCTLCKKYKKAKEKVLFKGFEFDDIHNWGFSVLYIHPEGTEKVDLCFEDTIEDLFSLCVDFEWELTEEKTKELGL